MECRICGKEIHYTIIELGEQPLSNSYLDLREEDEVRYPLNLFFCTTCGLLQLPEHVTGQDVFDKTYPYLSSCSSTWLGHSKKYVKDIIERMELHGQDLVVEVASNDGYLLQYFKDYNIACVGIEPAETTANIAIDKGIPTEIAYLDTEYAEKFINKHCKASLVIANNVLAHNPNIHEFVEGLNLLLEDDGVLTIEVPYLLNLVKDTQFDTIYHEHYSYFSLKTLDILFDMHGMNLYDVEEVATHGGSIRIYVSKNLNVPVSKTVVDMLWSEERKHLDDNMWCIDFKTKIINIENNIKSTLVSIKDFKVMAYGAPAKGNTFLNTFNIGTDLISYTVDANPLKQNKYLPGSRIPVKHPDFIKEYRPDYILILPWNLKEEIMSQLSYVRGWGCKFIVAIPEVEVLD